MAGDRPVDVGRSLDCQISDAVLSLRETGPNGHLLPEKPLVALNLEHVRDDRALTEGDELALLPPLAGG